MSTKKRKDNALDQDAVDQLVTTQAGDDSSWEAGISVQRPKLASLSIPGELAARAAFLAKVHRDTGVDQWIERIVRERVELEEHAFAEAKKQLAS